MGNFLLGLIAIIGGMVVIYYSADIVNIFGRVQWAETNLGGTKEMIILIGMGIIILGILFMSGTLGGGDKTISTDNAPGGFTDQQY